MTPEQLEVGERNAVSYCTDVLQLPKSNMTFVLGQIENLDKAGIESNSLDMIISNCVVGASRHSELCTPSDLVGCIDRFIEGFMRGPRLKHGGILPN